MILEVTRLIPKKTIITGKNNIYVKNFPRTFNENDLKKVFEKYGDLTSITINRDDKGASKGFGYVCFANEKNAQQALDDIKEKNLSFPGCDPLYVNHFQNRDERQEYQNFYHGTKSYENCLLQAFRIETEQV